jgi:hypothetical protein
MFYPCDFTKSHENDCASFGTRREDVLLKLLHVGRPDRGADINVRLPIDNHLHTLIPYDKCIRAPRDEAVFRRCPNG